jgi:hypothetical protein
MASAFVFGSASMHSQFQVHHPWPTRTALAIQAGERILLRHCGGIVPPLFSSNIFDNETTNALQAESIGTFTQIPPDLKRYYFGHVHCPAVA